LLLVLAIQLIILGRSGGDLVAWYVKGSVYWYDLEIGNTLRELEAEGHLVMSDGDESDHAVYFGLLSAADRASYQVTSFARHSAFIAMGLNLLVLATVLWPRRSHPAAPVPLSA